MSKRYEIGLALSALLALGCGGNAVDLGHAGGKWTDTSLSPSDPGTPQTVYEGEEPILGFALDGPTLYALIKGKRTVDLVACPLTRCLSERTTLFSRRREENEFVPATRIVVAAGLLYWTDTAFTWSHLVVCPTTGCPEPQVLASDLTRELAADESGAYWLDAADTLQHAAPDAKTPTGVRDLSQGTSRLAAGGEHLYFVSSDNDSTSVQRVRKDGTRDAEVVATDRSISAFSLATDTVYYLSRILTGRVAQCSLDGCATGGSTLASDQRWPGAIRVEGNEVFWLNSTQWEYFKSKVTLVSCLLPDCAKPQTRLAEFPISSGAGEEQNFAVNQDSIVWLEAAHGQGSKLQRLAR